MLKSIRIVEQIPNLLSTLFRVAIGYYLCVGLEHLRHIFFPISHEASTHAGRLKETNVTRMNARAIDVLVQIDFGSRQNVEVLQPKNRFMNSALVILQQGGRFRACVILIERAQVCKRIAGNSDSLKQFLSVSGQSSDYSVLQRRSAGFADASPNL